MKTKDPFRILLQRGNKKKFKDMKRTQIVVKSQTWERFKYVSNVLNGCSPSEMLHYLIEKCNKEHDK